ncbi:MAG TPA: sugar phosphate nucleotidyltransferase [Candidatus Acidoferrum sp.]|nr:sugar phosphate nucleotidyltransferase [Candidatus Acidoferrum sp.]
MHIVILAGGGGTRLWPLSSPDRPKPFLPLLGDESLLQRTVRRLGSLPGPGDVTVVTDRRYRGLVRSQVPDARILAEPTGRNTAVAIALAAVAVDRPDDEVMIVLPADQQIAREDQFAAVLADAAAGLAVGAGDFEVEDPLVTLGIQVTRPATEYGYLVPDLNRSAVVKGLQAYVLKGFEEKPNRARAQELFEEGAGVAWNAGIFLWRRRAIRAALERYTAILTMIGPAGGTEAGLAAAYDRLTPISIDYAVMEGSARDGRVLMGAMDVGWSDLGGWPALLEALGARPTGRVVPPGEAFEAGPDDLIVERERGRLALVDGPRGSITSTAPTALLAGAAPDRDKVAALVDRVAAQEVRS